MSENTTTTVSAGAEALEALKVKFADMTATEVELGFGDCHCDWRAPLAKVKVFKEAEDAAAEGKEYTVDYNLDGTDEEMTGPEVAAAVLEKFHSKTEGKIAKEKAMSGEKDDTKAQDGSETPNQDDQD